MRRPLSITLAALPFVAAAMSLVIALSGTTITHYLPPIDADHFATQRTAVFVPAIIASVVAGLTVLATAVWVPFAAHRPRSRGLWLAVVGLVMVDFVVLVVTLGRDRPTF